MIKFYDSYIVSIKLRTSSKKFVIFNSVIDLKIGKFFDSLTALMCFNIIISRVQAVTTVLDAFGSCRTGSNMAATKFSQIFSVDFDRSGAIVSASIQVRYLLLVGDGFESLPKTASRLKTLNQWRAQCLLGGGKP